MKITLSFDDGAKHVVLHVLDSGGAVEALRKRGLTFLADAIAQAAALGEHVLDRNADAQLVTLNEAGVAENEEMLAHSSDEEGRAAAAPPPEE